ncbi:MAG: hypothetical protein AUH29_17110 [Candidatus Rokubacteria bacterium 13_1_40CM_69_27]|nr:MAG: hypothetical protein AUH29_17110 [Candidatus Rokubacteria bacterium 13_1_40CM_69_27]
MTLGRASVTGGARRRSARITLPTETAFAMEMSPIKFGLGATDEIAYEEYLDRTPPSGSAPCSATSPPTSPG